MACRFEARCLRSRRVEPATSSSRFERASPQPRRVGLVSGRAASEPAISGRAASGPAASGRAASAPAASGGGDSDGAARARRHLPRLLGRRRFGRRPAAASVTPRRAPPPEGFDGVDAGVVRRLAGQAAVALAEVGSVAEVRWLVQVNKVVLDSVREGIALFGRNGRVILSNAAIERIAQETIGTSAGGTIARGPAAIAALTRDPAACVAAWERILSDPPSRPSTSSRSPRRAGCSSSTPCRSTLRPGGASAACWCCATSPTSARPKGSSPT